MLYMHLLAVDRDTLTYLSDCGASCRVLCFIVCAYCVCSLAFPMAMRRELCALACMHAHMRLHARIMQLTSLCPLACFWSGTGVPAIGPAGFGRRSRAFVPPRMPHMWPRANDVRVRARSTHG